MTSFGTKFPLIRLGSKQPDHPNLKISGAEKVKRSFKSLNRPFAGTTRMQMRQDFAKALEPLIMFGMADHISPLKTEINGTATQTLTPFADRVKNYHV